MANCNTLIEQLKGQKHDRALAALYLSNGNEGELEPARGRAIRVAETFGQTFGLRTEGAVLFSGPGRSELGGNHTDHQHGHVLCGSVNLDMLACAAPNGRNEVRLLSEGYGRLTLDLSELSPKSEEKNTTAALIRGVAAGLRERGCEVKGFDACVSSNVLSGSGLSSSAAFEILIGTILNHFCAADTLDHVEVARIGQRAENEYFGKPCGLMDQIGCAVGGAVAVDFADPNAPVIRKTEYDFSKSGHALCIVDTGSDHADLTDDYALIPQEMGAIAACFGKQALREVPEESVRAEIPALRCRCGDRAVLRALHFYDDDRRAVQEAEALAEGDFSRFLKLINASGLSSELLLQNVWSPRNPQSQAVPLALALGRNLLDGTGAIRVHGGGFAGTIQAFVPAEKLRMFKEGMEAVLGEGKCHVLHIRPMGGCVITE